MVNLREIAFKINAKSVDYRIGKLQSIRKEIKGLQKKAVSTIFFDSPNTLTEDWAYHYGGRSEMQFNIGFEEEGFRFGLAFSLEPSQTLPDISILYPKIFKFNCLIRERPELFKQFKLWYWRNHERSEIINVREIGEDLISVGTFIFFGKLVDNDSIDIDQVLETFDYLLDIYLIVENEKPLNDLPIKESLNEKGFTFDNKLKQPAKNVSYTTTQREIDIEIRHSFLQEALKKQLETEFGIENVSIENPINGNKIDIVVKDKKDFYFYEIKTGSSPLICVRQAIGQLFEYAYGNCKRNASLLFIASEFDADLKTINYLEFLRNEFKLPIYYKKIDLNINCANMQYSQ